jgi:hypothetical protein
MSSALWTPPQGTIGCDTSAPLDASQAAQLVAAGYRFLIRFIGLAGETPSWGLTAREASLLQAAGLALGIVQIQRKTGISAARGAADGAWAATLSQAIGSPAGATLWCDLEGGYADVAAPDLLAYLDAWADAVGKAGYAPGLCSGPRTQPSRLGAAALGALPFEHHWMSAAAVPDIPTRGYQMFQLLPMTILPHGLSAAGTLIAVDVVQQDSEGGAPIFWQAPRASAGLESFVVPSEREVLAFNPTAATRALPIDANAGAGDTPDAPSPEGAGEAPPITILRASSDRYLASRGASEVQLIVIHTMETELKPGSAGNLARSWHVAAAPGKAVSAHYSVDAGAIFNSVSEDGVAFQAGPKANRISIGIEHAGWSRFTAADWNSDDAQSMLTLSAQLVADICRRRSLPVAFVAAADLQSGQRGITTHAAVSAGLGGTDHTDPGGAFPMDAYLALVTSFL